MAKERVSRQSTTSWQEGLSPEEIEDRSDQARFFLEEAEAERLRQDRQENSRGRTKAREITGKCKLPSNPNMFRGIEYPMTLHFRADCYNRRLKHGDVIGYQTIEDIVRLPNGELEKALLYWIVRDGVGRVESLGQNVAIPEES